MELLYYMANVMYTKIPAKLEGEVQTVAEINEEGNFFRCHCGHVCVFSRMTNQYEYYACIDCGDELQVC
jgi:transcription initiation factor IIE alpha subunit